MIVAVTIEQLIERDGPGCVWCGRDLWRGDLTLEHVVPRSRGGHMTADNALVACRRCNRRRGSRPVDAYVRELLREGAEVNLEARASRRSPGSGSPTGAPTARPQHERAGGSRRSDAAEPLILSASRPLQELCYLGGRPRAAVEDVAPAKRRVVRSPAPGEVVLERLAVA